MTNLHITNGDHVAEGLLKGGITDAVLPWRDVLHDGPVPGGLDSAALAKVRAAFLAERGWTTVDIALADITGRDAQLAALGAGDNVVLWFEPDLYDQLQLLQILARLYLRPVTERPAITIVAADELLGPLSVEKLLAYSGTQRVVREVDLELAAQGWEAFTASAPALMHAFADTENALFKPNSYSADSAVVLPHVHAAMRRLMQEFPSSANGLSRTEQQMVDVLLAGERSLGETYRDAHAPREEMVWLGDWSFAWYVERLMRGTVPLVELAVGAAYDSRRLHAERADFWKQVVRLTEAGVSVARGASHAIKLNGIDRWIGGVHLLIAAG